ncbi:MAG: serine hydrolase [Candidatus Aminicenantes bacterium]|nr:serine hydrolase [Candidatus Aminicenantes bacterium]
MKPRTAVLRLIVFIGGWIGLIFSFTLGDVPKLPLSSPEEAGMSSERLEFLDVVLREAVGKNGFPGAVVLVIRRGKVVFRRAYGHSCLIPEMHPMVTEGIFDMASLTKPVATATSILILVERGLLSLSDRLSRYFPDFKPYHSPGGEKPDDVRVWHLLTHTSGLAPFIRGNDVERASHEFFSKDLVTRHILQMEKTAPPGKKIIYSDLGFILLASLVEKISGQTIEEFTRKNIFMKLGMKNTFFIPREEKWKSCVPTEHIYGRTLQGIVHDPLSRIMGGAAGHAGLFSTGDDMAVFAQMMLNGGEYEGVRILAPLTVEKMTEVYPTAAFSGRGLGWDLDSPYSHSGGDLFGSRSYGHTGYTGTSLWIDPETETALILLTNRVHPHDAGSVVSVRSRAANIVAASIIDK